MTTTTAPVPATTATCDKVRDPLKDTELAGELVWNCIKSAGHDNRGAHLMKDDKGRKTHWRGADKD